MAKGKISDLFFEIGYKINPDGFKKAEQGMENMGKQAENSGMKINKISAGIEKMAMKIGTIATVGYAFKKVADYTIMAVNAQAEFDDKLRTVVSKIGASEEQLKLLAPTTRQVAREYHVLAGSVAEAQDYLALAGYSLEEIKAGTPSVVAAQRATGESMQAVSDIATDTASAYGYTAEGLDFITDRMVYTTTKFNTNFAQMGEAMKYVAPIAKQAGMEFEDLSSYIGVVANSGIKGSQAGTALRMAFLRLQAPTKMAESQLKKYRVTLYDSKGEFVGINKAMLNIEKATKKMNDKQKAMFMQQVFGTESMSAMNIVFKEGIENIIAYGDAIGTADGVTQRMAEFMEQGVGGLKRSIQSEKEAISLTLGEALEPASISFLETIKSGLEKINMSLDKNKEEVSDITTGLVVAGKGIVKGAVMAGKAYIKWIDVSTLGLSYLGRKGIKSGLEYLGIKEKEKQVQKKYEDEQNLITEENFAKAQADLKKQLGISYDMDTDTMVTYYDDFINYLNKHAVNKNLGDIIAERNMQMIASQLAGGFTTPKPFEDISKDIERRTIELNVKIDGTDTLGQNMADLIVETVQGKFEESMKFELSQTNFNLGGGYY